MLYIEALGHITAGGGMDAMVQCRIVRRRRRDSHGLPRPDGHQQYKPALARYHRAQEQGQRHHQPRPRIACRHERSVGHRAVDRRIGDEVHLAIQKGIPGGIGGPRWPGTQRQQLRRAVGRQRAAKRSSSGSRTRAVLRSIVNLTGGTSFEFDIRNAWQNWLARRREARKSRRPPRRSGRIVAASRRWRIKRRMSRPKPSVAILGASADRAKFGNKSRAGPCPGRLRRLPGESQRGQHRRPRGISLAAPKSPSRTGSHERLSPCRPSAWRRLERDRGQGLR